jgi:radical SAM-linked protein
VHSRVNRKWLAIELKRALEEATLSVCGPQDCHGCAPFARDCVKGIVAETTGRPLDSDLPMLSTPAAPGPGRAACADLAPPAPQLEVEQERADDDTRPRYRYRARFEKSGRLRFLGHLDLVRMLMRALRRAGVPLVYSQGFNPKPKVSFGPALSVGLTSEGEYMDFEAWERIDPKELRRRVQAVLPPGLTFVMIRSLHRGTPKLGDTIRAARYRVNRVDPADLERGVERWKAAVPITIERLAKNGKTKIFDLSRELVTVEPTDDGALRFTLAIHHDGASVRPGEALRGLFGEQIEGLRVVREDLLVEWNGRRLNPLLAAAASDGQRTLV